MTPADRDEFRRMLRDELARARVDILAESKRHATGSDLDAEARHGAQIAHERMATDAKLEELRLGIESSIESIVRSIDQERLEIAAKLKMRRSENPGLDLALRSFTTGATLFLFLWLARKGLIL